MNRESNRDTEPQESDQRSTGITDEPAAEERTARAQASDGKAAAPRPSRERTGPRTFLREVRGELKRVAWPSAKEVRSYSIVVLVTVTLLTLYVFGLDWGFGRVVFQIFG